MKPAICPITAAGFALAAALAAVPAHAVGTVEVSFVKPETYADIGRSVADRERHLDLIARHLKTLGDQLPAGQALKVEVLDIDLAGEERLNRHLNDRRVLRGRTDWPRMSLRYTLSSGNQSLKTGEETLSDMAYLMRGGRLHDGRALAYELRMVDNWFVERFVAAR